MHWVQKKEYRKHIWQSPCKGLEGCRKGKGRRKYKFPKTISKAATMFIAQESNDLQTYVTNIFR